MTKKTTKKKQITYLLGMNVDNKRGEVRRMAIDLLSEEDTTKLKYSENVGARMLMFFALI